MRDQHILPEILNVFTTLFLKVIFWKTKIFFKKLEYSILVQSTKIESATFPHKTALPEANINTNRIESIKRTYHKGGVLPLTTLVFWKFGLRVKTSFNELIKCTNYPTFHIHTFRKGWSFIWRRFFPVSIFKTGLRKLSILWKFLEWRLYLYILRYLVPFVQFKKCEKHQIKFSFSQTIFNFLSNFRSFLIVV